MNAHSRRCVLISLSAIVLAATSTATIAQWYPDSDPRSSNYQQYLQQQRDEFNKRQRDEEARNKQHAEEMYGQKPSSPSGGSSAGTGADIRAERPKLLAMPPLPAERNVLLGSWRLEGSTQQSDARQSRIAELGITGKGSLKPGDLQEFISSMGSGQLACDMSFGRGITFTPTTYSSGGAAGMAGGPIAYRSPNKQVIVGIPGDARANPMFFEVAGPNRIVWGNTCALVRVGSATPAAQGGPPNRAPAASPQIASAAPSAPSSAVAAAVRDGAAFRCSDGSLLFVSLCEGASADVTCKLTELHRSDPFGTNTRRADIAVRVTSCEAGGIRYGADNKPVFVKQ